MSDNGVGRITAVFKAARAEGRAAFMPYYTVGYPDLETSVEVLAALVEAGADLIEVGVPFSDPLADGPTIQAAAQTALEHGTSVADVLQVVYRLRQRGVSIPLVLMGYYNPFLAYGIEALCRDAAAFGADGFIVPDLPPDERDGQEMIARCRAHGLAFIPLLAPTSTEDRIRIVTQAATGFVYLVSVTGITGARDQLPPDLAAFVARVRAATDLPLAVGFGISKPEQAAQVARIADGVVVGSALVKLGLSEKPVERIRALAASLAQGVRRAPVGE
ncbi:MAG: tryptophan synthase subunit alpha [Chloroflexi bacterium]|nr:tryptophan synthase subunit alpha [Chloroflexota bacterium]